MIVILLFKEMYKHLFFYSFLISSLDINRVFDSKSYYNLDCLVSDFTNSEWSGLTEAVFFFVYNGSFEINCKMLCVVRNNAHRQSMLVVSIC